MTKNTLFFLLLLMLSFTSCSRQTEKNTNSEAYLFSYFIDNGQDGLHLAYSQDGLIWKELNNGKSFLNPKIGKDKLMRDPSIVQDKNGIFHMVWTTGWWDKTIGYASSKDLRNWSAQKLIPVMEKYDNVKNSWAPELFYDEESELFYIFWASTIPGAFPDIADSDSEKGLNHRQYYVTTKDFETFSETNLFFEPGFSVIDGAILKKDREYFLFVKNENPQPAEKNIRITHNSKPYDFPITVSAPITGDYWAEGPAPLQVGNYTYVYFDKYMEHKYGAVRSEDMTNWEDVSDRISLPSGVRHGTAFKVPVEVLNNLKNN